MDCTLEMEADTIQHHTYKMAAKFTCSILRLTPPPPLVLWSTGQLLAHLLSTQGFQNKWYQVLTLQVMHRDRSTAWEHSLSIYSKAKICTTEHGHYMDVRPLLARLCTSASRSLQSQILCRIHTSLRSLQSQILCRIHTSLRSLQSQILCRIHTSLRSLQSQILCRIHKSRRSLQSQILCTVQNPHMSFGWDYKLMFERVRKGHHQSDKHGNCFKGNTEEIYEDSIYMGFERINTILNWTELILNSCFLNTVSVTLLRIAVVTAINNAHKLFHTGGVPNSLTSLFWWWLTVSSVFVGWSAGTNYSCLPPFYPTVPIPNMPYGFSGCEAPCSLTS